MAAEAKVEGLEAPGVAVDPAPVRVVEMAGVDQAVSRVAAAEAMTAAAETGEVLAKVVVAKEL